MRKAILIIFSALLLLTSCATSRFTDEEARTVLVQTFSSVVESTYANIKDDSLPSQVLLPISLESLVETRSSIPGLSSRLADYEAYASSIIPIAFSDLSAKILSLADGLDLSSPRALVLSSSSSMTELFKKTYYEDLLEWAGENLRSLGLENAFTPALEIYNNYITLKAAAYSSSAAKIEVDICRDLADSFLQLCFSELASEETFVRTTPAVTNDAVMRKVFSLKLS
jgi:hypothetical protein